LVCVSQWLLSTFSSLFLPDKTKFEELESSYQELQQKYHLAEQNKSEYDLLKENFDTGNLQLQEQLAEERKKTDELQNIINQGTIGLFIFHIILKFLPFFWSDTTKFDELQSSYQELEQKYLHAEQMRSENESLKANVNTTDQQLQEQLAEAREKINELQNIISQGTTGLLIFHIFLKFLSSLWSDKTKFDELQSSYQELEQKYLHAEQIKTEYESLKENVNTTDQQLQEQLAEAREKINELQNVISQGTIGLFIFHIFLRFLSSFWSDKTKFDELESSYQELEQKYRAAEQIKSEYDSFKENADTATIQLQEQLAGEREKMTKLQNIIDQGTAGLCIFNIFFDHQFLLDKTKFEQLESSYQELEQKYRLAEQIKSEYDLLKQSFDTTNLQLQEQLSEAHEKINELQNMISEKTTGSS
jgi:acyl carrier protein phosphodiesterase